MSRSYLLFTEDLGRLGLRHRRHYDTRRTFISLGVAGGGRKDVLRWITHSPGDIFDEYTTLPWETLCAEVAKLEPPAEGAGLRLVAGGPGAVTFPVTVVGEESPENNEAPETMGFGGFRVAGCRGLEPLSFGVTGRRYNQLN